MYLGNDAKKNLETFGINEFLVLKKVPFRKLLFS